LKVNAILSNLNYQLGIDVFKRACYSSIVMRIHLLLIVTLLLRLFLQPVCTCDAVEKTTETHHETSIPTTPEPTHKCGKHKQSTQEDSSSLHCQKHVALTESHNPFEHDEDCPVNQIDESITATPVTSQNILVLSVLAMPEAPKPTVSAKVTKFVKSRIEANHIWSVPIYLRLVTFVI